jgi:hypothetical protein
VPRLVAADERRAGLVERLGHFCGLARVDRHGAVAATAVSHADHAAHAAHRCRTHRRLVLLLRAFVAEDGFMYA